MTVVSSHQTLTIILTARFILSCFFFFFNDTATPEIYPLSLHDALPISSAGIKCPPVPPPARRILSPTPHHTECGMRNAECGMAARASLAASTLHLHSALRIPHSALSRPPPSSDADQHAGRHQCHEQARAPVRDERERDAGGRQERERQDRKSTRLNSSHSQISYAVFCLKKKKRNTIDKQTLQHAPR